MAAPMAKGGDRWRATPVAGVTSTKMRLRIFKRDWSVTLYANVCALTAGRRRTWTVTAYAVDSKRKRRVLKLEHTQADCLRWEAAEAALQELRIKIEGEGQ